MRIPYREHWLLRRAARGLCRSDPHLAAMLAIFARLYVSEAIISAEQLGPHPLRRGLAWLPGAASAVAACACRALRWAFRRVAGACAAVRGQLGRNAPKAAAAP
jgi:hypothetical protein